MISKKNPSRYGFGFCEVKYSDFLAFLNNPIAFKKPCFHKKQVNFLINNLDLAIILALNVSNILFNEQNDF
ncbi:MAG: hypothetical protein LBF70_01545 [Holosporales bacterium]|nr:hypothetical protein [Holosporales bacterium]